MIWWYRNVFIDRNLPLTGAVSHAREHVSQNSGDGMGRSLINGLKWLKVKCLEKQKLRNDRKVYKNLSDHQLRDIGLTRSDLSLLLNNKTPVLAQQRVDTVRKAAKPSAQMARDSDLERPPEIIRNAVCCNDSGEKVA